MAACRPSKQLAFQPRLPQNWHSSVRRVVSSCAKAAQLAVAPRPMPGGREPTTHGFLQFALRAHGRAFAGSSASILDLGTLDCSNPPA